MSAAPTPDFDLIIVGGGLVGGSLASRLACSPLRIALIDGASPPESGEGWDNRIYAISRGSRRFLSECGAWQRLPADRLQAVRKMRILGDNHNGQRGAELNFDAYAARLPELAVILENRALNAAIMEPLANKPRLTLIRPARPTCLEIEEQFARLTLDDGRTLSTRLLVGADGANSWVRQQLEQRQGTASTPTPYQQMGVVANFEIERPHEGVAWQWFQPDGSILAWLPLPGNRMSMVWSTADAQAKALLALSPEELTENVAEAGQHRLGALKLITPAAGFPLRALVLPHLTSPRIALVGDAAHLVHPLAGQGVNLGFQDARTLAKQILAAHRASDIGHPAFLRRYERSRRFDILAMHGVTQGLFRLFNRAGDTPRWLRNTGLALTDRLPFLKEQLVRHALG